MNASRISGSNRVTFLKTAERLEVHIKPDRHRPTIIGYSLMAPMILLMIYIVAYEHINGGLPFGMKYRGDGPLNPVMSWGLVLGMLTLWLYKAAWLLSGLEVLTLDKVKLRRTRSQFGFARTSEFDAINAGKLEIAPTNSNRVRRPFSYQWFDSFGLRFEHRGRMVYLVQGLSRMEADAVLAKLQAASIGFFGQSKRRGPESA